MCWDCICSVTLGGWKGLWLISGKCFCSQFVLTKYLIGNRRQRQQRCWRSQVFKGSLWWKSTCLRLNGVSSFFPTQASGGGCQQWLKEGLYTGDSFQGENINLPVPPKFGEAEGGNQDLYSAQTGTLDARAGSLLMSLLNYVAKAEIHIAVSNEEHKT